MKPSNLVLNNEYSSLTFLGNLLGLQTIFVPNFGRNYALWSLANETWYYVLFPLLLLVFRCESTWRKGASALTIAAIASFLPLTILMYFSLWLLGAGFARIRIECTNSTRLVLFLTCITLSIYYRLTGSNADLVLASYIQDLLCSIPLLILLSTLFEPLPGRFKRQRLQSFAKVLSEFSFTLYVTHVPAIALLRHIARHYARRDTLLPNSALDYGFYLVAMSLLMAIAYVIYLTFEANTFRVRRYLKSKVIGKADGGERVAAVPLK